MYTLKVLRPFYLGGVVQAADSLISTEDRALAHELRAYGKVEFIDAPAASGPMTTDTAAAAVPGKSRRVRADDPKPTEKDPAK